MSIFKRKRRKAAVAQAVQTASGNATQIISAGNVSVIKSAAAHRPSTAHKPSSQTYGHFSPVHTPDIAASSILSYALIDSSLSHSSSYSSCDSGSSFSSSDSGCSF